MNATRLTWLTHPTYIHMLKSVFVVLILMQYFYCKGNIYQPSTCYILCHKKPISTYLPRHNQLFIHFALMRPEDGVIPGGFNAAQGKAVGFRTPPCFVSVDKTAAKGHIQIRIDLPLIGEGKKETKSHRHCTLYTKRYLPRTCIFNILIIGYQ